MILSSKKTKNKKVLNQQKLYKQNILNILKKHINQNVIKKHYKKNKTYLSNLYSKLLNSILLKLIYLNLYILKSIYKIVQKPIYSSK